MNKIYISIVVATILLVLVSCNPTGTIDCEACPPVNSLEAHVNNHDNLQLSNELIACAGGGHLAAQQDTSHPILIYFLPVEGARDFRYFETSSIEDNQDDFGLYQENGLDLNPIFNGFLMYFKRKKISSGRWCRVTYQIDDVLHISNPINLKYATKPTQFAPELVDIDQAQNLNPLFTWQDGTIAENDIYFQVISNQANNLLSGTYTIDQQFQYYDLSNVVININDVNPAPVLQTGSLYRFTLMGISEDNWVNLFAEKIFFTN